MSDTPAKGLTTGVMLTLALLSSIAPLGTDLYLSAFPQMVADLGTTETGVQLSLTAFLLGAGVGQAVFGPLSDRFGRIRPLLVGLVIAVAAAIVSAIAPTVQVLVAARLVQGLAAASGMVIGRAMITDLASGSRMARALSMLMVVGGVAPVVAPVLGSALAAPIGWRGLLWIVAALSVFSLVTAAVVLRETHPRPEFAAARTRARGGDGLTSRAYLCNTLAFAFSFATMMAYISASPFLYQNLMGLSTLQYGLAFGANALLLTLVSGLSARLAGTLSVVGMARTGLLANALAIVVIVILVFAGAPVGWLALPILVAVCALGLVFGNVTAMAMSAVPRATGTGSAWLGLLQFGLAGAVAPLVSLGGESSAAPLALTMLAATIIANLAFALAGPPAALDGTEAADGRD